MRADLALTLCGARSFLLDGAPGAVAFDTLTTTQQAWGYTIGWGVSAAPSLAIAYGPISLDLAGLLDTRYSLNTPDPWPDRHPSASVHDMRRRNLCISRDRIPSGRHADRTAPNIPLV